MSRIGSSSGVRVAATQLSNVYTVLLLVAALALILAVAFTCITLQKRYGSILPVGDAGDKTEAEVKGVEAALKATTPKLAEGQKALEGFLGGAPAPSAAPAETPATPAAETPATPAPEKPATPAAEKPATPAAPAAGEKPAAEKPAAEKPAAEKPAAGEKPAEAPATPAAEKPAAAPKAETPAAPAAK